MAQYVKFVSLASKVKWLEIEKDIHTLYWIEDTQELYKGETLFGTGRNASTSAAGLLSPDDKAKLDALITNPIKNLAAVNGSMVVDVVDGNASVKVNLSAVEGNQIQLLEDGLYVNVKGCSDDCGTEYNAGEGIQIIGSDISVKVKKENGLTAVDGALAINLATRTTPGTISGADKLIIDSIPTVYTARKYDVRNTPKGTLVDYRDHEIRIMCPENAEFVQQNVGETGNSNMYYMGFYVYAPANAEYFKEGDRGVVKDELFDFHGDFSGIDEFGRKYSVCWLALANYDKDSGTWSYFGKNSNYTKYIGWDYIVDWYDVNNERIGQDTVRINLTNESCHIPQISIASLPTELAKTQVAVQEVQAAITWGTI